MARFLALTLLIGFFAFLPSAFADGDNGLHIIPADVHQSASSGTAMLTLNATNIQVRAKWRLDGDSPFAINDKGELRLTATLSDPTIIVATVIVEDMFSELNRNYQNLAATALITVEFISGTLRIINPPARLLAAFGMGGTMALQTSGGMGEQTFRLYSASDYFTLGETSGILSVAASVAVGEYAMTIEVRDETATLFITVIAEVETADNLILADAPPLTATLINATVSLHTFTASGGLGTLIYALIGDNALHFSIDDRDGVLRIDETATVGIYTLSVEVADEAIIPQKATAVATVTMKMPEPLILADAPPLTATAGAAVSLHTFTASGGLGTLTYALIGDHTLHFSIDERGGVLRIDETATMGIYTLTVEVVDGAIIPQRATVVATVKMLEPLILADAPPLTVTVINATVSLHTFTASGGLGTLTYALIGDNTLHFSIDERGGVLRIDETATMGIYTLSVEVADEVIIPQRATAVATVTVVETLFLTDAPPLTATTRAMVSLHTFTASGGLGTLTYALIGNNTLHFSIDEKGGVLWIDETATVGIYTLSVEVADGAIIPQKATAVAKVTVDGELRIINPPTNMLFAVSGIGKILHTFQTSGGKSAPTFSLASTSSDFYLDELGGTLSVGANAAVGIYTLTVEVVDGAIIPQRVTAMATVAVMGVLTLKAKVSDRSRDLHFNAPYASAYSIVTGNDDGYFAIGKTSGTLAVQAWTPVGNYPLGIGITYTFSLGIPPKVVVSAVVVEITDYSTPTQRKIYVLGGYDGSNYLNDVWSSVNGTNWSLETSSAGWSRRGYHQALSHNGKIYVLGGAGGGHKNDVWSSVNGINWSLETSSTAWSQRYGNQALSHNGRLYVLGGSRGGNILNDVWSSPDGKNWERETDNAGWVRRWGHQALSHNGRLYVLGGYSGYYENGSFYKNDVWSSADGKNWRRETDNAGWAERSSHQALSHNGRLYVLGGDDGGRKNDVWSSADGKNWRRETDNAGWAERSSHQALSHNGRLYVLGGAGGGRKNDVWSSANGKEWTLITLSADWSQRDGHQAVVFPSPLVLFGVGEKITMTAGVAADNLHTFTAQYGKGNYTYSLEPAVDGFAVSDDGVLSADGAAIAYTLSVFVADEEGSKAQTAVRFNVIRMSLSFLDASEERILPVGYAGILHTLTASGGYGDYTYTLSLAGSGFAIDANGVLSADGTAMVGAYTLSVFVADKEGSKAQTAISIKVKMSLSFLDASEEWTLPFGWSDVLKTLTASGGYGDYTYTLSPTGSGFVIDANGVLSADGTAAPGEHTITVEVADEINSKTATWTGKVIII